MSRAEEPIRRAIVLAASRGACLAEGGIVPKTLQPVLGVPLIVRAVRALEAEGLREVVVVLGFGEALVRAQLLAADLEAEIVFVRNPRHEAGNGLSVLAARAYLDRPCVLSMGDHLVAPALVRRVMVAPAAPDECVLGVDYDLERSIDVDEATKVRVEGGRVVAIGKALADYDGIDTGVFRVGPSLVDALDAVLAENGDCSLSEGVGLLAARGKVAACDVRDTRWVDIDEPFAFRRAEMLVRLFGDDLDASRKPARLAPSAEEQAIRRLGTHVGKEIVLGFDRHLTESEARDHVETLSQLGRVTVAPAIEGAHWIEIAARVGSLVAQSASRVGVLVCSTGIGMAIAANKVSGVYAARCLTPDDGRLARTVNNANVLCLAGRAGLAANREIIEAFFTVPYEGRKLRELEAIGSLEATPSVRRRARRGHS
jgi:RpiB/LacA/LacB family sugar-phosphate isomerase